jgi:hypothetical protein
MTNNVAGYENENVKNNYNHALNNAIEFHGEQSQQSKAVHAQSRIPSARILSGRSQDTIMANLNRSHGEQPIPPPIKV